MSNLSLPVIVISAKAAGSFENALQWAKQHDADIFVVHR